MILRKILLGFSLIFKEPKKNKILLVLVIVGVFSLINQLEPLIRHEMAALQERGESFCIQKNYIKDAWTDPETGEITFLVKRKGVIKSSGSLPHEYTIKGDEFTCIPKKEIIGLLYGPRKFYITVIVDGTPENERVRKRTNLNSLMRRLNSLYEPTEEVIEFTDEPSF